MGEFIANPSKKKYLNTNFSHTKLEFQSDVKSFPGKYLTPYSQQLA